MSCVLRLQVKKETQKLREFEEGLVSQYKFYLENLEQTIKGTVNTPFFVVDAELFAASQLTSSD